VLACTLGKSDLKRGRRKREQQRSQDAYRAAVKGLARAAAARGETFAKPPKKSKKARGKAAEDEGVHFFIRVAFYSTMDVLSDAEALFGAAEQREALKWKAPTVALAGDQPATAHGGYPLEATTSKGPLHADGGDGDDFSTPRSAPEAPPPPMPSLAKCIEKLELRVDFSTVRGRRRL
jgi:hypothetical protein